MNRDAYLSQHDVAGFAEWAGHLVRGEWGLEHSWKGKGPPFRCHTLYEAFQNYRWPNSSRRGESAGDTMTRFANFRRSLDDIGIISTSAQRDLFVSISREIAKWGGIRNLARLYEWERMEPQQLQYHIAKVRQQLNPVTGDTDALGEFRYMGSAFSKIYAALIPGLPIYDSRVACALLCLVRLYCRDAGLASAPGCLALGIPAWRATLAERCRSPQIYASQEAKYAKANLQFAWLMQGLTADPGEFAQIPAAQRVDALQSALFMLGYTRLADDAVVKSREGTPASAG